MATRKNKPWSNECTYESKNFDMEQNTYTTLFKLCNYNIGQLILNYFILAEQPQLCPVFLARYALYYYVHEHEHSCTWTAKI